MRDKDLEEEVVLLRNYQIEKLLFKSRNKRSKNMSLMNISMFLMVTTKIRYSAHGIKMEGPIVKEILLFQ